MTQARFVFGVMNLPLRRDLTCGPFILSPVPEGQAELMKRGSMDREPVFSAEGVMPIPDELESGNFWAYIEQQPINQTQLLLSLAERRYVEVFSPTIQHWIDGEWQDTGSRFDMPLGGNPHGVSWHHGHDHLQEYMSRCLPILADPERGEKQGLRLAIQFYRTNFRDDFVELQYLKSWLALETLFSRHRDSASILNRSRFDKISKAIGILLKNCQTKGLIEEGERVLMRDKLNEINRLSAKVQALRFFEDVFKDHPAQVVTQEQMDTFAAVRNGITHQGVMRHKGEGDYGDVLNHHHGRLKSLLERTFLAMMGQDANLMSFSWEMWLAGA
jgi:hypothetical protein